jgi:hypothetical protein
MIGSPLTLKLVLTTRPHPVKFLKAFIKDQYLKLKSKVVTNISFYGLKIPTNP